MYKSISLIFIFIVLSKLSFAQSPPDTLWTKTYGGNSNDRAVLIDQTSDGGFIILGNTWSYGAGYQDIWIVKIDDSGNELWNRTFGGADYDCGKDIKQTSDGGFIIIGETQSFGLDINKIWLIKTDESGNEEWNQLYGDYDNRGNSVIQTPDDGYLLAGATWIQDSENYFDLLILKTDSLGNVLWSTILGESLWDEANYIIQDQNNDILICGFKFESYSWFLKFDELGNLLWDSVFVTDYSNYAQQFIQTEDMGFILTGYANHDSETDFWAAKIDDFGSEEWTIIYEHTGYDMAFSISNGTDTGYIIAGDNVHSDISNIMLKKIDDFGNLQWNSIYGGDSNDHGRSIKKLNENGFVLTGSTSSYGNGYHDFWVLRLDSESSNIYGDLTLPKSMLEIYNYPNPFNPITNIAYKLPANIQNSTIQIINIKGQIVDELQVESNNNVSKWNADCFPSGVYFYKLNINNSLIKKMILIK